MPKRGNLRIGAAGSAAERQAESFARRFGPGPAQPGNDPLSGGLAPAWVEHAIAAQRASGEPLDADERAVMGAAIGHKLPDIRIHEGAAADTLNRALNASAFTVGHDIFFRDGMFRPDTAAGCHVLAHEVAHAQQSVPVVQRIITIGNKSYEPDKDETLGGSTLRESIERLGPKAVAMYERMMSEDGGIFQVNDPIEILFEIRFRLAANDSLEEIEGGSGCCDYGGGGDKYYHLDGALWAPLFPPIPAKQNLLTVGEAPSPDPGDGREPFFQRRAGTKPSEAIRSIFTKDAGTKLECNSMMIALQYKGLLDALGDEHFDRIFDRREVRIEPALLDDDGNSTSPLLRDFYTTVPVPVPQGDETKHLIPGDWVYFKNHENYHKWSPNGAWQGENAQYVGDEKFSGFGMAKNGKTRFTHDEVIAELLKQAKGARDLYNIVHQENPDPEPKLEEIPGLRKPDGDARVRRLNMRVLRAADPGAAEPP